MRTCPKCKERKSLTTENFYKNKSEVGGFQYTCKVCHKNHYKRKSWGDGNNKEYKNKRYKNDPEFRLLSQLRVRVNQYLKKGNQDKTIDFLGCSIKEWRVYLEQQWDGNMTWENHGTYWEIDHIYPLSKGGSFHYTNTQPMEVIENRKKSNKVI
jgi:hypothetical protein